MRISIFKSGILSSDNGKDLNLVFCCFIFQSLTSICALVLFLWCALYMGLEILIQFHIINPNQEKNYVSVQLISTTIIFEMIASIVLMSSFDDSEKSVSFQK